MYTGRLPVGPLKQAIRRRSQSVTVERRDSDDESDYGDGVSYTELPTPRDVYIGARTTERERNAGGERRVERLNAYTLPSTDLRLNDRVRYESAVYEVSAPPVERPADEPVIVEYDLERI